MLKEVKKPNAIRKIQRETGDINKKGKIQLEQIEKTKKEAGKKIKDVSYLHRSTGIKLKHPYNWEVDELAKDEGFSLSPSNPGILGAAEIMQVSVQPVPNKKDMSIGELDKWFINKSTLSTNALLIDWYIPSFNLISSEDATLYGKPARKFIYTGESQSVKYKTVRYLASFDKKIYSVSFLTAPENFDAYLPDFEDIFETLTYEQVKKSTSPKGRTRK